MNPIDEVQRVAEHYANERIGFQLVNCSKVGLPVYKLTVRVIIQKSKDIPPIEEFILKAVNLGLNSPDEIGGFLGLEKLIVRDVLIDLTRNDDVDLMSTLDSRKQTLKLTPKGKKTLQNLKSFVREERSFPIAFDGLIRKLFPSDKYSLLTGKNLREDVIEIRLPSEYKRVEVENLNIQDLDVLIQKRFRNRKGDPKTHLLRLKEIEKKSLLFQQAVMLVYKAGQTDEIQFSFAIDGRLSKEHEEAFARVNTPQKRRIVEEIVESSPEETAIDTFRPEIIDQITSNEEVAKHNREITRAKEQIKEVQEELEEVDIDDEQKKSIEEQIKRLEEQISNLQSALKQHAVRFIDVYEHPQILEKALRKSQERLMIISPWINTWVVDGDFLKELEQALKRKVQVFIGYGIGEGDSSNNPKAVEALQNLAQKYEKFLFRWLGDTYPTHAKVLIYDKTAVTGSFNWLSFKGDVSRQFRDERGTLVSIPEEIDRLFNEYVQEFISN